MTLYRRPASADFSPEFLTGTPRREFMYSDDMADACVYLMNLPDDEFNKLLWPASLHTKSSESHSAPCTLNLEPCNYQLESCNLGLAPLVNVGVGEDLTIKELAETVKSVVGYAGTIEFDSTKPDGTPRKLMDVGRLNAMGWQVKIEMQKGLAEAYRDFLVSNVCQ